MAEHEHIWNYVGDCSVCDENATNIVPALEAELAEARAEVVALSASIDALIAERTSLRAERDEQAEIVEQVQVVSDEWERSYHKAMDELGALRERLRLAEAQIAQWKLEFVVRYYAETETFVIRRGIPPTLAVAKSNEVGEEILKLMKLIDDHPDMFEEMVAKARALTGAGAAPQGEAGR